jgi:prophage maintenance system killer protein
LALNGADLTASNDEFASMILDIAAADAAARDETTLTLTTWFEQRLGPWSEEDPA